MRTAIAWPTRLTRELTVQRRHIDSGIARHAAGIHARAIDEDIEPAEARGYALYQVGHLRRR